MKKIINRLVLILIISALCLSGCGDSNTLENKGNVPEADSIPTKTEAGKSLPLTETDTDTDINVELPLNPGAENEQEYDEQRNFVIGTAVPQSTAGGIESLSGIPDFSDSAYYVINGNVPNFTESDLTTTAFLLLSPLDELGRCGGAYANVCRETIPEEERSNIGSIEPSGWKNTRYDNFIDGYYLYNRCHLVAYNLSGDCSRENLITGTKWLNNTGMLPFEEEVGAYIRRTENHVLYRCTPIFEGGNLVASGVQLEAFSVEDFGEGICFNVFIYNVQPGIVIDYASGDNWLYDPNGNDVDRVIFIGEENDNTDASIPSGEEGIPEPEDKINTGEDNNDSLQNSQDSFSSETKEVTYVLNKNTNKFHLPKCDSVKKIKDKNREDFYGSRDDAIEMGYEPCGNCKP